MALTYKIAEDDESIFGNNATELALSLRDGSFDSSESLESYMKGFSERYEVVTGVKIRYDNAGNFVEDLINNGYLVLVE